MLDCMYVCMYVRNNTIELGPFRHLIRVMIRLDLTRKDLATYIPDQPPTYLCTSIREHPKGEILETCDL